MGVDPNEVGAFISSVGNKDHLVHLKTRINERLLVLGHPQPDYVPAAQAITAPTEVVRIVGPKTDEIAAAVKDVIGEELFPHVEAVSLGLDWKSYLKTILTSVIQEIVTRALAGATSTAPQTALPAMVFERHPQMKDPVEAMQAAGMSWLDIWDALMTYGPAVVGLVQKIIADWKAKQAQTPPAPAPTTPPTAMA